MGKIFDALDAELVSFIESQKLFFVATAPLDADGLVNLSPKGLDTFRILGPREVAYLDLTGSGIETLAHLRENGRVCFMFCAFDGRPRILRLHGRGERADEGERHLEGSGAPVHRREVAPGERRSERERGGLLHERDVERDAEEDAAAEDRDRLAHCVFQMSRWRSHWPPTRFQMTR